MASLAVEPVALSAPSLDNSAQSSYPHAMDGLRRIIAERVGSVRAAIRNAALAVGRNPAAIELLAAVKTRSADECAALLSTVVTLLGENRTQEGLERFERLAGMGVPSFRAHFIGQLQSNKIRKRVKAFDSVGRARRLHWMGIGLALCLAAAAASLYANGRPPRPVVTAGAATGTIDLNGVLSEPAWAEAGVIPDLTQQSPYPGKATPYHTEVRIFTDKDNLYFGITCYDPSPSGIAVHSLSRDSGMSGDDTVTLVFDTFNDRRTGYLFRVNASGARADGLISGPDNHSLDWDGIWYARTRRTTTGWTAEIVIPAKTLHFKQGEASWGFNVERYVPRGRITFRWADPSHDASLWDLRRAGTLSGLADLRQGIGLSVTPYWLGRSTSSEGRLPGNRLGKAGLDVAYNLTPSLTTAITFNTDFAETEVDTRTVNLTRFPLFFPEKRAFFLEGSNQFRFGSGLGTDFIPFYSRRIGLFNGRIVPLDAGLKVLGQVGPFGIALLGTRMGASQNTSATNLYAGRVTYDVDPHLRLGLIGTYGNPDSKTPNNLAGFDVVWRTATFLGGKNFQVGAWGARSGGDLPAGSPDGWGFRVDYPNDLWDISVQANSYGDALDPALGFMPRAGTRQYEAYAAYQPRPKGGLFAWVRQFYFQVGLSRVCGVDGRTQSFRIFTAPFNAVTQTGWHLECDFIPEYEFLSAPFGIAPGVTIPVGEYRFNRYDAEFQSPTTNPWRAGVQTLFGGFYSGNLTQTDCFLTLTSLSDRLKQTLDLENDFGHLPQGSFVFRVWQYKALYAWDPDHSLSAYFQYDTDTHQLGMNARLVWIVRPGNDIYLVWNRNWVHIPESPSFSLAWRGDEIALKVRWTFRW